MQKDENMEKSLTLQLW